MGEEYPKRTDPEAARLANALFGDGWLLPISIAFASGLGGYVVGGVSGIFFAETATGCVTGVVLYLKSQQSNDDEHGNMHVWVPMEYEDDED